jgi:hypothetical protein
MGAALALTGLVVAFWLGRVLEARRGRSRYASPSLHVDISGERWISEAKWTDGRPFRWHLSGKTWEDVPVPPMIHKCWPQTCEISHTASHYDRCACGGSRWGVWGQWEGRNTRVRSGDGSRGVSTSDA